MFYSRSEFLFTDGSYGKNVIIFGADMSSSVNVDNTGKYILILGKGPTQGLDDTTLTAEAKYSINFTLSGKRFVLSLHSTALRCGSFSKKKHRKKALVPARWELLLLLQIKHPCN